MKNRFYFRILFFSLFFLITRLSVRAEGSKELYVNTNNTGLYCCNDLNNHCNQFGYGNRSPFAVYDCPEPDRLYFITSSPGETVYLGFSGSGAGSGNHLVFRIKDISGNIVYNEMNLPTSGTGFIANINEARSGPIQISGTSGYTAINWHPAVPGTYYIEFNRKTPSGSVSIGGFNIDLFDITICDTVAHVVKPGRLHSKAWQFTESFNCSATTYVYSNDSIITFAQFNNMDGGTWIQFCNQWGCQNTNNFAIDRKSLYHPATETYLPQYKIFLNSPDQTLFPPATTLGQVVPPDPWGERFCNTGHIIFHVNVDRPGNVEITLSFTAPYLNRKLNQTVVVGENLIDWDGLDGTTPTGIPVPNNTTVTFTVSYINGLTNMPFFDVEGNPNGFNIGIVAPVGTPPLVYWDDLNIPNGNINLIGCLSPGCHTWNGQFGNLNTVNTWWYNVSASTNPINITEFRNPQPLVINQSAPYIFCENSSGVLFSVNPDLNTDVYHWSYDPPTGVSINQSTPGSNSVALSFGAGAQSGTLSVYGTNTNCAATGPTSSVPITLLPVPGLTTNVSQNTCAGVPFSISLSSTVAGTTYSWSVGAGDCSSNITTCPTGTFSGASINGNLSVTDLNPGTVVYHVTPSAGICTGATKTIVVTVAPKPNVTSPSTSGESFCSGGSTNVVLQSGLTGPSLSWNWEVLLGNCNNIQTCPTSGTTSPISNTLILGTNTLPGSIIYTITPTYGGCAGDPVNYAVTVFQLPDVVLPPFAPVCLNTPTFTLSTGTPAGGTYLYQGNPITTFNPATMGVGVHTITYTYTDLNGCTSSDQKSVVVQGLITPNLFGSATACIGVAQSYSTDGGMVPSSYQWSVSPDGIITGATPETRSITWNTTGVKTISVIYTDPNGCQTIPANYQVTVNSLPVPTVAGNNNVCYQKTYTYTTESGMTGYVWNVSPGNTLVASGNSASVTWNVIGSSEWVEVNYINGNGCTAVTPERRIVNVNASPSYTVTGDQTVCAGTTGVSYSIPAGLSIYAWSVSSGGIISGPATNNSVLINWMTTATANQTVSVSYTNSLGCSNITNQPVTIHPLPVATFTTSTPSPVCQDYPTPSLFTVDASGPASTYLWQITPPTLGVMTDPTANPLSVTWKLPGTSAQSAQLRVTATTTGAPPLCSLTSLPMTMVINPKPNTQLQICFDAVTTQNAKPFVLKGGLPLGSSGVFRIDNLSGSPVTTITPAALSIGNHTIYYTYTDNNGCIATDSKILRVDASNAGFSCGSLLTDPRDNQVYKTVLIGGKCWMQENLRYHTANPAISHLSPQTDNCVWEKYCLSTDPTCSLYGGMYQWDELMQYTTATKGQGFCPPGWHVPDDAEWAVLINAISSLTPGDGIAGSYLRDVNATGLFKAGPAGVFYLNSLEAFSGQAFNASFFWTSTVITAGRAVTRGLNDVNPSVSFYEGSKADAFPVRCVKDN